MSRIEMIVRATPACGMRPSGVLSAVALLAGVVSGCQPRSTGSSPLEGLQTPPAVESSTLPPPSTITPVPTNTLPPTPTATSTRRPLPPRPTPTVTPSSTPTTVSQDDGSRDDGRDSAGGGSGRQLAVPTSGESDLRRVTPPYVPPEATPVAPYP